MMYIIIREQEKIPVYFKKQIQVGDVFFDKAFIKIPVEYSNYSNVFSMENAVKLFKNTKINKHAIKLKKCKQLLFDSIYSLGLVKLEILKIYIKINLGNGFI